MNESWTTMATRRRPKQFLLCVRNEGCEDLELRKLYPQLSDAKADASGYVRVINESVKITSIPPGFSWLWSSRVRPSAQLHTPYGGDPQPDAQASFIVAARPVDRARSPGLEVRENGTGTCGKAVATSVIACEVKASSAPHVGDAVHLRWLRDQLGDRFVGGVIFHTGPHLYGIDDRIVAAPICALWGRA